MVKLYQTTTKTVRKGIRMRDRPFCLHVSDNFHSYSNWFFFVSLVCPLYKRNESLISVRTENTCINTYPYWTKNVNALRRAGPVGSIKFRIFVLQINANQFRSILINEDLCKSLTLYAGSRVVAVSFSESQNYHPSLIDLYWSELIETDLHRSAKIFIEQHFDQCQQFKVTL